MMPILPYWTEDAILPGFDATTLEFTDDYDGAVQATLVRRRAAVPTGKAFLYIHGYLDYFFQTHLADEVNASGFDFYALDLRKYGRSLGENGRLSFCKNVREYFEEISAALRIATEIDGNEWLVLNGHSTGGLTASLYAHEGKHRDRIDALFLNSPFFDFNLTPRRRFRVRVGAWLAPFFPDHSTTDQEVNPYMESIDADYYGEWTMNKRYRPTSGITHYVSWFRAISRAHQQVRRGLSIACPVLVMHSDKSVYGKVYHPSYQSGDGVLNVEHIRERSRNLGQDVKIVEIEDGLHDLVLSRADVREKVFAELFSWLENLQPERQMRERAEIQKIRDAETISIERPTV